MLSLNEGGENFLWYILKDGADGLLSGPGDVLKEPLTSLFAEGAGDNILCELATVEKHLLACLHHPQEFLNDDELRFAIDLVHRHERTADALYLLFVQVLEHRRGGVLPQTHQGKGGFFGIRQLRWHKEILSLRIEGFDARIEEAGRMSFDLVRYCSYW